MAPNGNGVLERASERWEAFVHRMPALDLMPQTHRRYHAHLARIAAAEHAREVQRERAQLAMDAARQAREMAVGRQRSYTHPGNGLRFSLADRWAVIGFTGSGKTVLTSELVNTLARMFPQAGVNILDSKGDSHFNDDPDTVEQSDPPAVALPGQRIVWRPPTNDRAAYESWCESLLRSDWPAVVDIDDLASLGGTSGGVSFPLHYHLLLKQGRDREKCVISGTQRSKFVPVDLIGQTTHLIRMRLIALQDAALMDEYIHGSGKVRHEPEHTYGFWYRRMVGNSEPIQFRDWREMLGIS